MPELPEVETIIHSLRDGGGDQPPLIGKIVVDVQVFWKRTLAEPGLKSFQQKMTGQRIADIYRRGKFAILRLDSGYLLFHLRMSGDLRVEYGLDAIGQKIPAQKHDRLILDFADGYRLAFNDTRKFGRAWLVKDPQTVLKDLGPEPLDKSLNDGMFHEMLHAHARRLKPLLLDQKFMAGIGNIYCDEALHRARLHPLMNSKDVTSQQAEGLLRAIRGALREGIERNGASIDWVYRGGDFQNHFRVYQCTGEPCPVCGTPIERIVIGQRSTHFCPACQPAPQLGKQ